MPPAAAAQLVPTEASALSRSDLECVRMMSLSKDLVAHAYLTAVFAVENLVSLLDGRTLRHSDTLAERLGQLDTSTRIQQLREALIIASRSDTHAAGEKYITNMCKEYRRIVGLGPDVLDALIDDPARWRLLPLLRELRKTKEQEFWSDQRHQESLLGCIKSPPAELLALGTNAEFYADLRARAAAHTRLSNASNVPPRILRTQSTDTAVLQATPKPVSPQRASTAPPATLQKVVSPHPQPPSAVSPKPTQGPREREEKPRVVLTRGRSLEVAKPPKPQPKTTKPRPVVVTNRRPLPVRRAQPARSLKRKAGDTKPVAWLCKQTKPGVTRPLAPSSREKSSRKTSTSGGVKRNQTIASSAADPAETRSASPRPARPTLRTSLVKNTGKGVAPVGGSTLSTAAVSVPKPRLGAPTSQPRGRGRKLSFETIPVEPTSICTRLSGEACDDFVTKLGSLGFPMGSTNDFRDRFKEWAQADAATDESRCVLMAAECNKLVKSMQKARVEKERVAKVARLSRAEAGFYSNGWF